MPNGSTIVMYEGYGFGGHKGAKMTPARKKFGGCARNCMASKPGTFKAYGSCMRSCLGGKKKSHKRKKR